MENHGRSNFTPFYTSSIDQYSSFSSNIIKEQDVSFKLNTDAKYTTPSNWSKNLNTGDLTKLQIYVNAKDCFQAKNLNIFTNYMLTFYGENTVQKWMSGSNMTFYQNQLNFAVWCSSSGCGVSVVDHLNSTNNLISSVFTFHIYYQTRKILEYLGCPIPGDSIFSETDNKINMLKYQQLCNEFGVETNVDFRFKNGDNGGLGTMYNYTGVACFTKDSNGSYTKKPPGYYPLYGNYNSKIHKFVNQSTGSIIKIDYIWQKDASAGWKQFLLEKSEGFTKAGVARIDESIRTYVYCILGSQAQTRSSILTSSETQQYFIDLLEQNIKSLFSIPESIAQYQNSITKTNSRINFVVGIGLYMMPADMVLKLGSMENYNNNILVAEGNVNIGFNENINKESKSIVRQIDNVVIQTHTEPQSDNVNNLYLGISVSMFIFLLCRSILKK